MSCPRISLKLIKYGGKLLGSGCSRTKNCIRDHFSAHICYAYPLKQWSYFWKIYMKEFVEAKWGEDLYLTRPSYKAIGGQICKKKHRCMQRNAINAKNLYQIFINLEESSIHCLALGPLLNRDWTLWVLSPK